MVAVNSDDSVRRLKGKGRPINPQERRMAVLAGLEAVDWVVCFEDDTPRPLLQALQPDVLVKGGDYKDKEPAWWAGKSWRSTAARCGHWPSGRQCVHHRVSWNKIQEGS